MFGTWRFDANPENDTLTQQPVDPATARPHVLQACQSCREKKIRCSSEKSGCARCKTLSKPCVYTQRGEGKRSSRKRGDDGGKQAPSDADSRQGTTKRRASHAQRDKPASPGSQSKPKTPQAHSAAMASPALDLGMPSLVEWPTPGFVTDDPMMGDAPTDGLDAPSSDVRVPQSHHRLGEDEDEAASARRESAMAFGHWLSEAVGGPKSPFDPVLFSSPPWLSTGPGRPNDAVSSPDGTTAVAGPTDSQFEVSLLHSLPTPKSRDLGSITSCRLLMPLNDTTNNRPARQLLDEHGRERPCLCLQHVAFLVHELESTPTKYLDAGLSMHKEAVTFGESMLLCLRCSRRPENLTLLTFLSERLLRLGEKVARIFLQAKKVPVLERPAVVFGEYEVDSPMEWELVLSHLIAQQLGAHKRLARSLKATAETLGSESVCRKAAETEDRAAELVDRLLVNSVQFLRPGME